MFNYSLAILAMFWILEAIKRYSINSAYTVTISISQAFLLIAGVYILWYHCREVKRAEKELRLLRQRNIRIQPMGCPDPVKGCEAELNFICRVKVVVKLNNLKFYKKHKRRLQCMLKYQAMQYILTKKFNK